MHQVSGVDPEMDDSMRSWSGAATAAPEPRPCTGPGTTLRILIVDDEEEAAALMEESLSALGHAVAVAHDGPSALRVARAFQPDTALIDLGLPVMDGYELARRLREAYGKPPHFRLVAVTGYGRESERRLSREAGFDEHLVKPVDAETLRQVLQAKEAPAG